MYAFVDTTESATNTPMSIQTVFNSINLDGVLTGADGEFRTLTVSGRDVVARRILSRESFGDGDVVEKVTLEPRVITVKYMMSAKTNKLFRDKFERLNGLLLSNESALEFTDEDAYFIAVLQGGDTPEEDSNIMVSTLSFLCSEPTKRRQRDLTIDTTTDKLIEGHTSTPWKANVLFTSNASSYEFEFNAENESGLFNINKIVLNYDFISGDVLKIDYSRRLATVNDVDITNTVVILQSNFKELPTGYVEFSASHKTEVLYNERYY